MNTKGRLEETKTMPSNYRILVVEDDDDARLLYCGQLQKAGYLVDGARNLEEALSRIEARTYHVAVVDIMLNGPYDEENRDGVTVLDSIKRSRYQIRSGGEKIIAGTRSIALTGQNKPQLAAELVTQHGANDYLDKGGFPNLTDELKNRIQRQLKEAKISLYGDKTVISFLAGPGNEGSWVDKSLRILRVSGGYVGLERFFSALCDPIAPLIQQKDAESPTTVDAEMAIVIGRLWSKALALPILLIAAHDGETIDSLSSRIPELDPNTLLVRHSGQGLTGLVFELKNYTRSQFKPSVV